MSKIDNIKLEIEAYEKILNQKFTNMYFYEYRLVIDIHKNKREVAAVVLNIIGKEKVIFDYVEGYTEDDKLDHIKIQVDLKS